MRRRRPPRGFTLLEIMVVCALLGAVLLLVPARLDGYGARSRLEQGANVLASAITDAHDRAIIDGHGVILEYDLEHDRFRMHVSAQLRERATPIDQAQGATGTTQAPPPDPEEEWMETAWIPMPEGVDIVGYSEAKDAWEHARTSTVQVTFSPEGIVRPAHALRVESKSLPSGHRTMTVRVNALTSLSEVVPGEAEMPEKREPHDFR